LFPPSFELGKIAASGMKDATKEAELIKYGIIVKIIFVMEA
jgi:hypothetical protein